ncbi:MAG: methyltransferase [Bacteroidales bacterium]|nr:methyltransferase [Candidatus Liminaster caballi]
MSVFHFKQFDVAQDRCAMKVGTDGVLLGAMVDPSGCHRVLDIGAGTGLIALMTAQKIEQSNARNIEKEAAGHDYHIDAVEIDPDAARQASENFEASPWSEHLTAINASLLDFMNERDAHTGNQTESERYDLMVSNPPFYNATLKPEDEARAVARHKDALPLCQIMQCAKQWLTDDGRLALIYPTAYDQEVMTEAVKAGLSPVSITDVVTRLGKPCKRKVCIIGRSAVVPERKTLAIRTSENEYTHEYLKLTQDFYLSIN